MKRLVAPPIHEGSGGSRHGSSIDSNDNRPLEALRGMNRDDLNRLAIGLDHALSRARSACPLFVDVPRELRKSTDSVATGALEQSIDVRKRSDGLVRAARGHDGAYVQSLDCFR